MSSTEQRQQASNNGGGAMMRQLALAHLRQEGVAAAQAGRLQQAQSFLQQALALDGENAELWILLGTVSSDAETRAICARRALELVPDHPEAQKLLQHDIPDNGGDQAPRRQPQDVLESHREPVLPLPQTVPAPQHNPDQGTAPSSASAAIDSSFRLPLAQLHTDGRSRPGPRAKVSASARVIRPQRNPLEGVLAWLTRLDTPHGRARLLAAAILVFLLALDLALAGAYTRQYQDRLIPGVHVGGIDVGGLSPLQVQDRLEKQVRPALNQAIELRYQGQSWRFSAAQLGLYYHVEKACQDAWQLGRQGPALYNWWERGRVGLWDENVPLAAEIRVGSVQAALDRLSAELDRPAILATVAWQEGNWVIKAGQDGQRVQKEKLLRQLQVTLDTIVQGQVPPDGIAIQLDIPVEVEKAALSEAQVARLQQQLNWIGQPLELSCEEHLWTLERTSIAPWILVESAPPPDRFSIRLDQEAIERDLQALAPEIARSMEPAQLEMEGERVVAFRFGTDGRILDLDNAVLQVEQAFQRRLQGEAVSSAELPVEIIPAGDDALMAELGIQGLVGEGSSTFVGSPPDRSTNILVGGQELHGRLIAPGEIFSFNAAIDPVTWEKGYRSSAIIVGNSVVMGLGGGLCQVATTMYRAVLYSGLEIVERHTHAWRVDWYEQDAPPGFDATIAIGGPDLKFRNNTGHYLLIQVDTRLDLGRQTIRFYGTPPAWEVSVDNLYIGNNGHSVSYDRTVTQDGAIILQETIYSYYQ